MASSSTMEKFWLQLSSGDIVECEEHFEEEGITVPFDPVSNGWVRGGLSSYTGCLHLETRNLADLRRAVDLLSDEYSFTGVFLDINLGQDGLPEKTGYLDLEGVSLLSGSGRLVTSEFPGVAAQTHRQSGR